MGQKKCIALKRRIHPFGTIDITLDDLKLIFPDSKYKDINDKKIFEKAKDYQKGGNLSQNSKIKHNYAY